MDAYRAINEILVHLFNEIWELEGKAVITEEYKDITNNDMRIIEAVANRLELPMDKVMLNIQRYGNTSAGTLPLALWDYEKQLKKGDNLILTAFGAGFTWGASYLKWGYDGNVAKK